ncbi:hypothetical protein ABIF50_002275 [Bradyrhizobium diazoefficiens]
MNCVKKMSVAGIAALARSLARAQVWATALLVFLGSVSIAEARNTPCSGKKGGVSDCENGKFVCKNGTISQSKLTCSR